VCVWWLKEMYLWIIRIMKIACKWEWRGLLVFNKKIWL